MEKLELLAQRITVVVAELKALREENKNLKDELDLRQMAIDDLQEQLDKATQANGQAENQVDSILASLQGIIPAAE